MGNGITQVAPRELKHDAVLLDAGTEFITKNFEVKTFDSNEINGEHEKQGLLFQASLFFVVFWSAVFNIPFIAWTWIKISWNKINVENEDRYFKAACLEIKRKTRKIPKLILKLRIGELIRAFVVCWLGSFYVLGRNPNHYACVFVDRFSKYNHVAKVHAAGWNALDLFYYYREKILPTLKNNFEGALTRWWIGRMNNRQAVANRRLIVTKLIYEKCLKLLDVKDSVKVMSIAAGSALAEIDAIRQIIKNHPNAKIELLLSDINKEALQKALERAQEEGIGHLVKIKVASASTMYKYAKTYRPDIIEEVGFIDYKPDKKVVDGGSLCIEALNLGGVYILANINKNWERSFLSFVLFWPKMHYRKVESLAALMIKAGFNHYELDCFYEPFKIHGIITCEIYTSR